MDTAEGEVKKESDYLKKTRKPNIIGHMTS